MPIDRRTRVSVSSWHFWLCILSGVCVSRSYQYLNRRVAAQHRNMDLQLRGWDGIFSAFLSDMAVFTSSGMARSALWAARVLTIGFLFVDRNGSHGTSSSGIALLHAVDRDPLRTRRG